MIARYAIGIDLGTTTCSMSYVDLLKDPLKPEFFIIPQWKDEGLFGRDSFLLPSFCYIPPKSFWKKNQFHFAEDLPSHLVLGKLAQTKFFFDPERTIASAKSWLCHPVGVDPLGKILPWGSSLILGDDKFSPCEAQALYLRHLVWAWNEKMGELAPFESQKITVTVPASFDEVACRLTLKACAMAGFVLENVELVEEPQAAFFSWLTEENGLSRGEWEKAFHEKIKNTIPDCSKGVILVCDMGGGTTDFSLFIWDECHLERLRVGEHILLGGDNINLRIAEALRSKLGVVSDYSAYLEGQLLSEASRVKEEALSVLNTQVSFRVLITEAPSAKLFQSVRSIEISRDEILGLILDGFFPVLPFGFLPEEKSLALAEQGLAYARDPRVTAHLSHFLKDQKVHGVLYTGGSLIPTLLRERLSQQIALWQGFSPAILNNDPWMELAVSRGAALYGASRFLKETPVRSGYPRNLYLKLGEEYLCLVSKGYDFLSPINLAPNGLALSLGRPVGFYLFSSLLRDGDQPGDLVSIKDFKDLTSAAMLSTKLKSSKEKNVSCSLLVSLSITGLLEISCLASSGEGPWKLEFSLDTQSHYSDQFPPLVKSISSTYGEFSLDESIFASSPKLIWEKIETHMNQKRQDWSLPLLRNLWDRGSFGYKLRHRWTPNQEASFLNFLGYTLRPGYGDSLDFFRFEVMGEILSRGLIHKDKDICQTQWWILWRRLAGGLSKVQQESLFGKIFPGVRNDTVVSPEVYLLLASLERIDGKKKIQSAHIILDQLENSKNPPHGDQKIWCLARIGTRIPLYTGLETVLPAGEVESWIYRMGEAPGFSRFSRGVLTTFYYQVSRLTGVREINLSQKAREAAQMKLRSLNATSDLMTRWASPQGKDILLDRERLFGEELPSGFFVQPAGSIMGV
jgi:molecular chaperone DnaK (HSP70)